ncbi:MAG TPA: hypothetical protein DCW64_10015 [Lactococcus lactis]|nr:hypothetical protein [Lactococcus lactis]
MTKDYLTSPFNDMDLKRISNTIDSISKTLEMYKSIMPVTYLTPDVLPIYKAINLMSSIKYPIDIFTNLPKINPDSFAFPNQLAANLSKNQINSAFELINRNEKVFREIQSSLSFLSTSNIFSNTSPGNSILSIQENLELLIKNSAINTNQEVKPNSFQSGTKSKGDVNSKTEKIETLQYALFEFVVSCKLFKESLNHGVSYSFDRILSNFGYSSALSTLISLVKPNDPLFLIIIFLIIGITQDIFKEK